MVIMNEKDRKLLQEAAEILEQVERDYPEDKEIYTDTLADNISKRTEDPLKEIALFTICTAIESILHTYEGVIN